MASAAGGPPQQLLALLQEGHAQGLFSGAAAAVSTPAGRAEAYVGTHAYGDSREVGPSSLFDLASLTKTFTAVIVLDLVRRGVLDLDEPVVRWRAVGAGPGADHITLRMLLSHTSGLPADSHVWRGSRTPPEGRLALVLATELESAPGAVHRYSCLGYIAAGAIAELASGRQLPELLDEVVRSPLGLETISYGPVDHDAAVATEDKSRVGRGMVRGEVHDELNHFLGGRVGNAGLFGAAPDVLRFAESFLDGSLLGSTVTGLMTTDALEPRHGAAYGQALGPRLGDREIFGDLPAFGHPGFTGTMWLAEPSRGIAATLLTNRVHPRREHVDINPFRRRFTHSLAQLDWEA